MAPASGRSARCCRNGLRDLVASVGDDGNIRVWQASTRQVLAILRGYADGIGM